MLINIVLRDVPYRFYKKLLYSADFLPIPLRDERMENFSLMLGFIANR